MNKLFYSVSAALLLISGVAQAKIYTVDYAASSVVFSGKHAGNDFKGTFEKWTAEIDFDPEALDKSHIKAVFDITSAKTGNAMYDGALPQVDWFDVKNHPQGIFEATAISKNDDGSYTAKGNLTLRDITHPAEFKFTLSDLAKNPVEAKASFTVDRLSYDIGKKSDGKAEWVSKDINLALDIKASAQ